MDKTCLAGQTCRGGVCRGPCEGVVCPRGQTCRADRCVDPCAGVSCAAGSYCGDGLCQTCNTADHCGSSCQACPAAMQKCNAAGACVECTTSAQCASGSSCDVASGRCQTTPGTDPRYEGGSGCTVGGARQQSGWLLLGCLAALGLGVLLRRRARPVA